MHMLAVRHARRASLAARYTGRAAGDRVHQTACMGCMQVQHFITALKREFYMRKLGDSQHPVTEAALDEHIFATAPGHGAAIATTACIIT